MPGNSPGSGKHRLLESCRAGGIITGRVCNCAGCNSTTRGCRQRQTSGPIGNTFSGTFITGRYNTSGDNFSTAGDSDAIASLNCCSRSVSGAASRFHRRRSSYSYYGAP